MGDPTVQDLDFQRTFYVLEKVQIKVICVIFVEVMEHYLYSPAAILFTKKSVESV